MEKMIMFNSIIMLLGCITSITALHSLNISFKNQETREMLLVHLPFVGVGLS